MKVKVTQSCLTLFDPMDCIVHGILQVRILEWAAYPFSGGSSLIDLGSPALQVDSLLTELSEKLFPPPGDFPNPGIKPRSPALEADSLPAEPPGKPKDTGVVSLSLLHGIFPTQGSNPGLLHCRWIL